MKNLLNTLVVFFLALSYTMAELVPNCSHVLHFSDEEVEFLQKVVLERKEELFTFYTEQIDILFIKKYPPHYINKNINNSASIDISSDFSEKIFTFFLHFFKKANTQYSWEHCYFSYFLLISMYEKLEFPPYNDFENSYYYKITFCLHRLIKYYMTMCKETLNEKIFSEFQKNENKAPSISEASSIFIPIKMQNTQKTKECYLL